MHAALRDKATANQFAVLFDGAMGDSDHEDYAYANVDLLYARISDSFALAADTVLPHTTVMAKRPWISPATLSLLESRNAARRGHRFNDEQALAKEIKKSVAGDRSKWLDDLVATGEWAQIRKLHKGFAPHQGRLKNTAGRTVSSEQRAETLASYLQDVQWAVRPSCAHPSREPMHDDLRINVGDITEDEITHAGSKLKWNRACGLDGIPGEFWKAIFVRGSPAVRWATEFCQVCWRDKVVPDAWHTARVATIFKKGDPSSCANYRPISLLSIGYKLFAIILLERLRKGRAEDRIWPTQFGFRNGRGTGDALFMARRMIEDAWAVKDGRSIFLALDWAKAFDSVSPKALARALRRFGLPQAFVDMVEAIYTMRRFVVRDAGCTSEWHQQHFGISQGCPLSPFLFVIVMTVLLHDAKTNLSVSQSAAPNPETFTKELVYADDTLLIDVDDSMLQQFMDCIGQAGQEYGLSFNWSKLEALPIRTTAAIVKPDGTHVECKQAMVYLGSQLSADGRITSELGRRIGMARCDFQTLQKVWGHTSIPTKRKVRIFDACVTSKLTYGLQTACLNKTERRRLDGFQARCLRVILRITPSFLSRVSNHTVLQKARQQPLSQRILQQQMIYMGILARRGCADPVRKTIFEEDGLRLKQRLGCRRVGRPRQEWGPTVFKHCLKAAGSISNFHKYYTETAAARAYL